MNLGGWNVFDTGTERHVMPEGDLKLHKHSRDCDCKPQEDERESSVIIHNSYDQRESYENGRKLQ